MAGSTAGKGDAGHAGGHVRDKAERHVQALLAALSVDRHMLSTLSGRYILHLHYLLLFINTDQECWINNQDFLIKVNV